MPGEKGEVSLDIVAEPRRIANRIVERVDDRPLTFCAARAYCAISSVSVFTKRTYGLRSRECRRAGRAARNTHGGDAVPKSATLEGFCKLRRELDAQPPVSDSRIRRFGLCGNQHRAGAHFGLGLEAYATDLSPIRKSMAI